MLLKKVLIRKINVLIWFRWMKKKTSSLIEDKRKDKAQRAHTRRNPKRHIPLVSLLLLHKMVAVHCFVWPLGWRLWSVSQAVSLKFKVLVILKFCIWPPVSVLLYLMLFYVLYGLVLFHKGDFRLVRYL